MKKPKWGKLSVAAIVEHIPNDGCLLVFNGRHEGWRQATSRVGVLRCHVISGGRYDKIRDLYIRWKGDLNA